MAAEHPSRYRARQPSFSRRGVILGLVGFGGVVAHFAGRWYNLGGELSGTALSVAEAHARVTSGDILLVDIRRPDEWVRTGIPVGAEPLDMRRQDFMVALRALTQGRDIPVALICARGVRSRQLAERLNAAGFTDVRDVPEGMLGSGAGPGWLRQSLPIVRIEDQRS
jgi:rhodanese-related sulfurtransferase